MNQEVQVSVYTVDGERKRHFAMERMERMESSDNSVIRLHAHRPLIHHDHKHTEDIYPYDVTMIAHKNWWFSLMVCRDDVGVLTHVYANINTPLTEIGNELQYVDLDIDMLIKADYSIEILDEDEFRQHNAAGMYPQEWIDEAWKAVEQIRSMVEHRVAPFSWSTQ